MKWLPVSRTEIVREAPSEEVLLGAVVARPRSLRRLLGKIFESTREPFDEFEQ
jgi:hypothetical protein